MFCHTLLPFKQIFIVMLLSSFRDQLFFILSQNICEAHAACAQEGQTEVRDMTIEGSCA